LGYRWLRLAGKPVGLKSPRSTQQTSLRRALSLYNPPVRRNRTRVCVWE